MRFSKDNIFWGCLLIATICLSLGYGIEGRWRGLLVALVLPFLWIFIRNRKNQWLPTVLLILYIGTAVTGLVIGCEPLLMISSVTPALGMWDVAQFQHRTKDNENPALVELLEREHFRSFGLALGAGFFLSVLGLVIRVQLPFGVIVLFTLITLIGLHRLYKLVNNYR